jgi:hypothetical protein
MNRVWIYQADRFLSEAEVSQIDELVQNFVASWTAHGSALAGKASVVDGLFLVLEVNEEVTGVTGCSIDKSVHFIKSLGEKFNINFFDRMRVAYHDLDGKLKLSSREEFQDLVNSDDFSPDTIVYNNLIQNSEELTTNWKIPFSQSWHSKVF